MLCLLMMCLAFWTFVAVLVVKQVRVEEGARRVKVEVSSVPGNVRPQRRRKKKERDLDGRDETSGSGNSMTVMVRLLPPHGRGVTEIPIYSAALPPGLKVGDVIEVLYNPEHPESVALPGENLWWGFIFLGIIGAVPTVYCLYALLTGHR